MTSNLRESTIVALMQEHGLCRTIDVTICGHFRVRGFDVLQNLPRPGRPGSADFDLVDFRRDARRQV
jgi:hypothetical protein